MSTPDHYSTLGIDKDASPEEIKKAFRKKAVQHHPDKGGDETVFKRINEAYNTLSDPHKKNQYDNKDNFPFGNDFNPFDRSDFMNMFFKQQRHPNNSQQHVQEIRETLSVDLGEAFNGCKKTANITITKSCKECVSECKFCNGLGVVEKKIEQIMGHARFIHVAKVNCDKCEGKGRIVKKKTCDKCKGNKEIKSNTPINIQLPPRTFHDYVSWVKHPDEKDVFIVIKVVVRFPNGFYRSGENLCYTHKIDLIDTFLGTKILIPHPSGEKIEIDYTTRSDIIRPDTVLHIPNKGIKQNTELLLNFDIRYPSKRRICSEEMQDTFNSVRDNLKHIFTR